MSPFPEGLEEDRVEGGEAGVQGWRVSPRHDRMSGRHDIGGEPNALRTARSPSEAHVRTEWPGWSPLHMILGVEGPIFLEED